MSADTFVGDKGLYISNEVNLKSSFLIVLNDWSSRGVHYHTRFLRKGLRNGSLSSASSLENLSNWLIIPNNRLSSCIFDGALMLTIESGSGLIPSASILSQKGDF